MAIGVVVVTAWALRAGVDIRPAKGRGTQATHPQRPLHRTDRPAQSWDGADVTCLRCSDPQLIRGVRKPGGAFLPRNGETTDGMRSFGSALAMAGMAVLTFGQGSSALAPNPVAGNLLIAGSSLLLGIRQVYTRWLVQEIEPTRTVVWQMAGSVPLFLIIAAVSEPMVFGRVTREAVIAIFYQGAIVAGICFIVWAKLLKRHSAGTLSMFAFLVPITGIALSSFFFGEPLRLSLAGGGILVLAGVYLVTRG